MDLTRRSFVASAALAPAAETAVWRNRRATTRYRRLGRTNLMISEFVFGAQRVRPGEPTAVEAAIEMGLNYLDTAPAYGNGASEKGLAAILAGPKRQRVFLATKVSPWIHLRNAEFRKIFDSLDAREQARLRAEAAEITRARRALEPDYFGGYFPGQRRNYEESILSNAMEKKYGGRIDRKLYRDTVFRSLEESLARLGVEGVDILMCPHGANSREEVTDFPEIFEAFETLRKQGRAQYLGVTAHSDPAAVLEGAAATGQYAVAQVAYNVINHAYVDAALDKARQAGIGVIAMKVARPVYPGRQPADPGYGVAPARLEKLHAAVPGNQPVPVKAYLWALRDQRLSAVNSEMTTPAMVRENLTAKL